MNDAHAATVNDLVGSIEKQRSEAEHLTTILTASGEELRMAVKKTLEDFGFTVVDVDAERGAAGFPPDREDLRIDDHTPALLVETKGLAGHPSDDDAHQVLKYVPLRHQELGRSDISALTVVNYQRGVAPWKRDPKAFRPEILANAEASNLGLLTTWDLYRLARNARTLKWPLTAVRAMMFRAGRVEAVPAHYTGVGKVERVLDKASVISIRAESPIEIGNRLAFESGLDFLEFDVMSMQVEHKPVSRVEAGTLVGVKVPDDICAAAGAGARVYRSEAARFT